MFQPQKFLCLHASHGKPVTRLLEPGDNVLVADNGTFVHLDHEGGLSATFPVIASVSLFPDANVISHEVAQDTEVVTHHVTFAEGGELYVVLSHQNEVLEVYGTRLASSATFDGHLQIRGWHQGM
jgi:hypothetical protein